MFKNIKIIYLLKYFLSIFEIGECNLISDFGKLLNDFSFPMINNVEVNIIR